MDYQPQHVDRLIPVIEAARAVEPLDHQGETCSECGDPILTMAHRGTGTCSQRCARAAGRHAPRPGPYGKGDLGPRDQDASSGV